MFFPESSVWKPAVIVAAFVLSSCAGAPEKTAEANSLFIPPAAADSPSWIWDSRPTNDKLVFVSAGTMKVNRDEEIVSALEDAAMQAGVFAGFWGSSQDFVTSTTGGTEWNERTRAYYDGEAADRAFEELKVSETWRADDATWGRFYMDPQGLPDFTWTPKHRDGEPSWLKKVPEISGWRTAVGIGKIRSTLHKTLRAADEAALAEMISQIHGSSKTVTASRETSTESWSESTGATASYGSGFGSVRGFLIIARWLDEKGNGWTLAACPKKWNTVD